MTEVASGESADSPSEARVSWLVHRLAKLKHHKDLVVLAIGIVVSWITPAFLEALACRI